MYLTTQCTVKVLLRLKNNRASFYILEGASGATYANYDFN